MKRILKNGPWVNTGIPATEYRMEILENQFYPKNAVASIGRSGKILVKREYVAEAMDVLLGEVKEEDLV